MNKSHSRSLDSWHTPAPSCHSEGRIQYLLRAEEQILQSISARVPIQEILDEICRALDCQIGNMVSIISLPEDNVGEFAAIVVKAALCGFLLY